MTPINHHPNARVYSLITISFFISASSLILHVSEVLQLLHISYVVPAHWNGLPKDLRQFAHLPNQPPNLPYPPLALYSATFHSRLKTEVFKLSYPDSTPTPRHVRQHHQCCHSKKIENPRLGNKKTQENPRSNFYTFSENFWKKSHFSRKKPTFPETFPEKMSFYPPKFSDDLFYIFFKSSP